MRCYCCNVILTPQESTRKFTGSGDYTDMCSGCLNAIDVETTEGQAYLDNSETDFIDDEDELM